MDESWTVPISDFKFKGGDVIPIKASQILLDTGLSYMMAPQVDMDILQAALKTKKIECEESHYGGLDLYDCSCSEDILKAAGNLQFKIGNFQADIPITTLVDLKESDKCQLLVYP